MGRRIRDFFGDVQTGNREEVWPKVKISSVAFMSPQALQMIYDRARDYDPNVCLGIESPDALICVPYSSSRSQMPLFF